MSFQKFFDWMRQMQQQKKKGMMNTKRRKRKRMKDMSHSRHSDETAVDFVDFVDFAAAEVAEDAAVAMQALAAGAPCASALAGMAYKIGLNELTVLTVLIVLIVLAEQAVWNKQTVLFSAGAWTRFEWHVVSMNDCEAHSEAESAAVGGMEVVGCMLCSGPQCILVKEKMMMKRMNHSKKQRQRQMKECLEQQGM